MTLGKHWSIDNLYVECSYAECHGYLNVMLSVIMMTIVILSVVMINVIMLNAIM